MKFKKQMICNDAFSIGSAFAVQQCYAKVNRVYVFGYFNLVGSVL